VAAILAEDWRVIAVDIRQGKAITATLAARQVDDLLLSLRSILATRGLLKVWPQLPPQLEPAPRSGVGGARVAGGVYAESRPAEVFGSRQLLVNVANG
jgi:hypothetical protein